jgi:hypothetical protein
MGGDGSGNWGYSQKKTTVDTCLSIDACHWMREGILCKGLSQSGDLQWSSPSRGEVKSSITFVVNTYYQVGTVRLIYTITKTQEHLDYAVGLQATRPHLGGMRWWFTCPLITDGRPCGRRVQKL